MTNGTSRRNWLKAAGLGVGAWLGAGLVGGCGSRTSSTSDATWKISGDGGHRGSIRIAHLTDFHVTDDHGGDRGMAKCLRHAQSLKHPPELILNTGDSIWDALRRDEAQTRAQWELWRKVLRDECSLPMVHCIGNHDVWGWDKGRSKTTGGEPLWGKRWAMDVLGMVRTYRAFDRGAWRFILLDSIYPFGDGAFQARLDEEQFAWLESELGATTRPVLIASHVPMVSPASLLDTGAIGGTADEPALVGRRVHVDVKRLGQLFARHPNVKLCVSGHLHQIDRADYRGVTYLTNPAVCGGWWKGNHLGAFGEMYTVLDLHPNGTFDVEHIDYGWDAERAGPSTAPGAGRQDA